MCESVDFFRQALEENGLDANVAHESDSIADTFYVSKNVAGETITFTTAIDNNPINGYSEEKRIAIAARNVADRFEKKLTEIFEWDGRRIRVQLYDEPEATCDYCKTSVGISPLNRLLSNSAELSVPQPIEIEEESVTTLLDDYSRLLLKMYLIGKLQEKCEPRCPNSRLSQSFYTNSS